MRLVADIGGTNARLALCKDVAIVPQTVRNFSNDDWPHLYDIVTAYLKDHASAPLDEMVIAVAGPVHGDKAVLTNRNWTILRTELLQGFGCKHVILINDLSALGYAVPSLLPTQLRRIYNGPVLPSRTGQSLVVGIGTGFNVSPVLSTPNGVHCLAVEAGHISMPKNVSDMLKAIGHSPDLFQTIETLFSGRGLTLFCQQVTGDDTLLGTTAIQSYKTSINPAISNAVDHYAALIGQLLRDLSLAYMPSSGIYLAGSVARAVLSISTARLIDVFAQPCDIFGDRTPSLFTIEDDFAALYGCAAHDHRK
jgi:glucokinase